MLEYWTGISHPPKSTSFAPRARCTEWSGVARSDTAAAMQCQANIQRIIKSHEGLDLVGFMHAIRGIAGGCVVFGAFLAGVPARAQVGLSGVWADRITEDSYERSGGPPLGDYQGIPLNDAGRMKADSHDHSEWSLPEFQCRPHPGPYKWRALGPVRITEIIDPVSRELTELDVEYLRAAARPIYLDGRPHPPEWAPHTWSGFSTGKWDGNTLVVTTTHLKGSYLRRNGAAFSDKATLMEYITRHGDFLLVTTITTDPVWLEE